MAGLTLFFPDVHTSLFVRRFTVHEALSEPFDVTVRAVCQDTDLDLEALVGQRISFVLEHSLTNGPLARRIFNGVCRSVAQVHGEETGLSTYDFRIAPMLWLLSQRRSHRIHQHLNVPAMVRSVFDAWQLPAVFQVDEQSYPALEIRVQYAETDLAFVARLLEEAGITYVSSDEENGTSKLVLADALHSSEPRAGGPIRFVDKPNEAARREYVTDVHLSREVRPGKVVFEDVFFRARPDVRLTGEARIEGPEARLEEYRYTPGAFLAEGGKGGDTPAADDKGVSRAEARTGQALAERALAALRGPRRVVSFRTNIVDLKPGTVFSIEHHPRTDLSPSQRLLVTELRLEGTNDGEWTIRGRAVFADEPYRPAQVTPKPIVHGVQSAFVVGPSGQEIHTDEFGRVRLRFPWARDAAWDDDASCWVRVSQGWAGAGFGLLALPRVGQEVLVEFVAGDPDQPIVVGRVFNGTNPGPYKLPEHKTKSTWRSSTSPGGGGFNEITFEDARGAELLYMQAERNLDKLVKLDETVTVGRNRGTTVGEVDAAAIGKKHTVNILGSATGTEMVAERISLTTGEATITLDGPNVTIQAGSAITLSAGSDIVINAAANVTVNGGANVSVHGAANVNVGAGAGAVVQAGGGDLVLQGGPMVKVNPGGSGGGSAGTSARMISFGDIRVVVPPGVDVAANIDHATKHKYGHPKFFEEMIREGGEWDFNKLGPRYEAFHLFHLGMIGRALGLPKRALMRYARKHHTRPDVAVDYVGPVTEAGCAYFDGEPEREFLADLKAIVREEASDE